MDNETERPNIEHIRLEVGFDEQERIDQLRELFPEVFTEEKIDFDKLKRALGDYVDDQSERYSFTWTGKNESGRLCNKLTNKTLVPIKDESIDFDHTQNIFIEGDNLEALKLLKKGYAGKVKMIYIDPPYNTGNDFIYNDKFKIKTVDYLKTSGQMDEEGKMLIGNFKSDGRFHSKWLSMMYPRLFLARQLLRDDGVIFISIDDNEAHNLRMIMNEIFGEENFVACMVWAAGKKNDSKYISVSHEYILVYVRNFEFIKTKDIIWRQRKKGLEEIYSQYEMLKKTFNNDLDKISDGLKKWFNKLPENHPSKFHKHYNQVDERGIYFADNISWPGGGGPNYVVLHPTTNKPVKVPSRGWIYSKPETMLEQIKENRVHFGIDESYVPCKKSYLTEHENSTPYSIFYQDGRAATKRLREIIGNGIFEFPKDETIIRQIIEFSTNPSDLILDFFSGSSTTAQAILEMNREDGVNRRFIMVQLPEPTKRIKEDGTFEESSAYKAGYPTIAEIGKERIRRVIAKMQAESNKQLITDRESPEDLGFKVLKVVESNFEQWDDSPNINGSEYIQRSIVFADSLKPNSVPENVIYEVAIKEGFGLNITITEIETITTNKLYLVMDLEDDRSFTICLDKEMLQESIDSLKPSKDDMFICLDSALNDEMVANLSLQCRLKTV